MKQEDIGGDNEKTASEVCPRCGGETYVKLFGLNVYVKCPRCDGRGSVSAGRTENQS